MRIFISQPMNGMTDEQIKEVRNRTIEYIKAHDDSATIIDSYIEEEPPKDCNQGIWYLGKSIELLASADMIWMVDGWQNAKGCILENEIACRYGLIINYATQEGC